MEAATKEEEKWIKKAQKLFNECPKDCCGEMDQKYIVGSLSGPEIDGGDW